MKKIGLICLALVLALGALGVGYAAWTDTIYIDGTVNTGEVLVEVICNSFDATDGDLPPSTTGWIVGTGSPYADENSLVSGTDFYWNTITREKNVGWVTWDCTAPLDSEATITLNNVYPSYTNHITLGLRNSGTIPLKLNHVSIKDSGGSVLYKLTSQSQYMTFDMLPVGAPNGVPDLEIYWGDNFGIQIEEGQYWDISFYIHVMQDEAIDFSVSHSYTLTFEFVGVQWNEYPLP